MITCFWVALGGAIGSVLRYLVGLININDSVIFPYKTLIINIVGSLIIGITVALAGKYSNADANVILFLKVGICGGFTTFSTFALESFGLVHDGRLWSAVLYRLLSVLLSICAVLLGQAIVK